jgi:nitroreductase
MVPSLSLTPDELLSTTRAVRRRLDFDKPVDDAVLDECFALAQQAPSGGNRQPFHFIVVRDTELRARIADIYRELAQEWFPARDSLGDDPKGRVYRSAWYLADRLHEVPVLVFPCVQARRDTPAPGPNPWSHVVPAAWSFMLAARSRGLGTAWLGVISFREADIAELLGVPYDEVQLASMISVGYTLGDDFKPAIRGPLERIIHRDRW